MSNCGASRRATVARRLHDSGRRSGPPHGGLRAARRRRLRGSSAGHRPGAGGL